MKEIELKFLVPKNKITAINRQTHIKSSKLNHLTAYYFDTPKQVLAKKGIAIRIRQEKDAQNNNWVQTIKTRGDGIASRLEYNHSLDSKQAEANHNNDSLKPDFDVYVDTEIAYVFQSLEKSGKFKLTSAIKKIGCLYHTDVKRTTRLIKKEDNIIEVAYDVGEVIHGTDNTNRQPLHEIEFEVIAGNAKFLFETAKTWCKRYNLCLSTITKAERGSLVLANKKHPDAVKVDLKALILTPNASKAEFLRAVVHNCLLQILPNASAIVAGSVFSSGDKNYGSDHVLQLRLGIGRLQTVLKYFTSFSEQINPNWSNVMNNAFDQLGEYCDRYVLQNKTQPMLEKVGSPYVEWVMDESITDKPIDAIASNDFQLTLLELIEFAMSDVTGSSINTLESKDTLKPAKKAISKILTKLFNNVTANDDFAKLEITDQQYVNNIHKSLRALICISSFSIPLYQQKTMNELSLQEKTPNKKENKAKAFIKHVKPVYKMLNDYNDSITNYEHYIQQVANQPNAYFAVGWLLAQQKESAKVCAELLTVVKDGPKFW